MTKDSTLSWFHDHFNRDADADDNNTENMVKGTYNRFIIVQLVEENIWQPTPLWYWYWFIEVGEIGYWLRYWYWLWYLLWSWNRFTLLLHWVWPAEYEKVKMWENNWTPLSMYCNTIINQHHCRGFTDCKIWCGCHLVNWCLVNSSICSPFKPPHLVISSAFFVSGQQ